ncbi:MAG TPA: tripartite tricarboxylate transporter substrate-binding protein, partial [Burkholderiales bacterium]|nr:tripartite tricarboxylate transporter substrate-binding protein [Burkholderiales bacterium]
MKLMLNTLPIRARLMLLVLTAFGIAGVSSHAQQFPTRPVRLVVPYPPGGANDTVVRLLAPKMAEELRQNVVVDNRGGGNTIIGSELVAKAVPDGHTILVVAAGHAINPSLYPKL